MNSITVTSGAFNSSLLLPGSKSYANRLLILGSIVSQEFTICNLPTCSDVQVMVDCLKKVGVQIKQKGNETVICNSFPACEKKVEFVELKTMDGGTTNRFLLALLGLGHNKYRLYPSSQLLKRPMEELLDALGELGAKVLQGENYYQIQGPILRRPITVQSSCSSQFASALALANYQRDIEVKQLQYSWSYYQLTLDLIDKVRVGKRFFEIPVDASALAYPAVLAATSQNVVIENCQQIDQRQSDSVLWKLFAEIGVAFEFCQQKLHVFKSDKLRPFEWDCGNCPDLAIPLAFLAAQIKGRSRLYNLEVLKFKESDRLEQIARILKIFEVNFSVNDSSFVIEGAASRIGCKTITAPADHRIIMLAYLFMKANSGGQIINYQHVDKSFPNFFKIMG